MRGTNTLMGLLTFDILDQCNLRCSACLQSSEPGTRKRMGLDRCRLMMDHATAKLGITDLAPFNWGEPLLNKELPDYLRLFATYEGVTVALSSNMTVPVPEDRIAEILAHVHSFRFSVSGWTQGVYQQYHRGGSLDAVKTHIERFLKVRTATGSATRFEFLFGRHLHNEADAEVIRAYCEANDIRFRPVRYYITSLKIIDRILHGKPVPPEFWNLFYPSEESAREEIRRLLTPKVCPFLCEVVADVNGNLMTCCGDKISLPFPLTEVPSLEALPRLRLQHPFCRHCFGLGLSGYFQPNPNKPTYSERFGPPEALPLKNAAFTAWKGECPEHWQSNRPEALHSAREAGCANENVLAVAAPNHGYINVFQYVEAPPAAAGALLAIRARGRSATPNTLSLKIHAEINGQWSSRESAPHPGGNTWEPLEVELALPDNFPGGRVKVEGVHCGPAPQECFLDSFVLAMARPK